MQSSILESIEKNLDDFYITCGKFPNCKLRMSKNLNWVKSKKGEWPDCIFKADFENLNVNKKINKIKRLIIKKKVPNAWTLGPMTKPTNLGTFLVRNGFNNVYQQAGMALDLYKMKDIEFKIPKLNTIKINNFTLLNIWTEIVSNVFQINIDKDMIKLLYLNPFTTFFLGQFNQNFVSALILHISSKVAGLHAVSTLPDYRGKGIAFFLSHAALKSALNQGIRIAVFQASNVGEKVYNKLGFEKYCEIHSFALLL
ncbi:MAG: GNAT family N-acetyltransferase [Candidatus Lokiarchaeota archaeon]|nr:GNAT family N-acetyltransferase [Candidatus Lokiarchaeota archaeon]